MAQKSEELITYEKIIQSLSNHFQETYDNLLKILHEEDNYKSLLRFGEKQFFDAPAESSIESATKSRRCFNEINILAVKVDEDIDKIIQKKLQGDFLITLKERVLKAVLELYSKQKASSQDSIAVSKSHEKLLKDEEKLVLEKIKTLSEYCAQNINDIRKQVFEMPLEGIESSSAENVKKEASTKHKREKLDIDNNSEFSFGSFSSVHTSDLSSFDDEISLTSDEESGTKKKRLKLNEVREILEQDKSKVSNGTKDNNQQIKNSETESSLHSECPINESSSGLQKSQRVQKPNPKYNAYISPLKTKSPSAQSALGDNVPRKRGRPRKHISPTLGNHVPTLGDHVPRKRGRPRKHIEVEV